MVVLPLSCFPDRLWFARYLAADRVVIDVGEHYVKQSYRNRFVLAGSHGKFLCTARVQGQKGIKTPIHQIRLVQDEWRRVAFRGLRSSYARSPYWEHYSGLLEEVILGKQSLLIDFNRDALELLLRVMGLEAKHEFSHDYLEKVPADADFRFAADPGYEENGFTAYPQVFEDRHGFIGGLSALDLVLNTGPEALQYLK